jgi:branched-chain amino acid transport system substrate-binding protein
MAYFAAATRGALVAGLVLVLVAPVALAGSKVVRIGVMGDMSGFASDVGGKGAVVAAEMAAADHGGKANGKPIEIIQGDMQNKPDVGAAMARQWFERDDVDAITDLPVSSVALAVQEVGRSMGRLLLVSAGAIADLSGPACAPYSTEWADDTYALSTSTVKAIMASGDKSWFFITADFAFGNAMERDATAVIKANGGEVVGGVKHPLASSDFSSYVLAAQASKAKVVAFANSGNDTVNSIKQAAEFGLVAGGQRLAGFLVFINDVHAIGLQTAQGLTITEGFYWDESDPARAFSKRFFEKMNKMPSKEQANTYLAVRHYLKAVDAAKSEDPKAVTEKMRRIPVDYFGKKGVIREDGRMVHDLTLYEVKKPAESKYPWDYYKPIRTIPADEAFRPMAEGKCPFVK